MGYLFSEPIYSQKIKGILLKDSPFYRKFYDSWMLQSYFSSKASYGEKFLKEKSISDILKSIPIPTKDVESLNPVEVALLCFLLVALKVDPLINHQLLKDFPKLMEFADRVSEQLILIPYRGTNHLISSVEEFTNSTSSPRSNDTTEEPANFTSNVIIYLSIVAGIAIIVKTLIKENKN
jgi:hypothetical protein